MQPYAASEDGWELLGQTPLDAVRLPRGVFRFRIDKAGFQSRLLASRNPGSLLGNQGAVASLAARSVSAIEIALVRKDSTTDGVPVPGGAFPIALTGFDSTKRVHVAAFTIDQYEVTNRQFKTFVDGGGYRSASNWSDLPFSKDGRTVRWQDVVSQFVDSTGRSGPAGWELGEYPPKPGRLSGHHGLGPYGTYDMAGNAREWVWNEAAGGRRLILGGAWNDQDYLFTVPIGLPPFDRSAANGFRCADYRGGSSVPETLLAPLETSSRDHRTAKAVSKEEPTFPTPFIKYLEDQRTSCRLIFAERIDRRQSAGNVACATRLEWLGWI